MNRILKGIALILVAAVFVSIALIGCEKKDLEEQKQSVYGQWEYCLKVHNTSFDLVLWALDQAQIYANDPSWDSLIKARTVASTAKLLLSQIELAGHEVDESDYLALLRAGLEPEVVLTEYEHLEEKLAQDLVILTCLEELLITDICLAPITQALGEWLNNNREMVKLECEYLSLTTNYLLLQWEYTEKWQTFQITYPRIANYAAWDDDPEHLMETCTATLDRMEELEAVESQFLGISQYTNMLVKGSIEAGGYEKLVPYLQTISGTPSFFPLPSWLPDELQIFYQITDAETGETRLLYPGEQILTYPSICYLTCEKIEISDFKEYAALLESLGLEVLMDLSDASKAQILCRNGESSLSLLWKDGQVDIYLSSPVGCLVPEWYLVAELSK